MVFQQLKIETPFVRVQGELIMTSTRAVTNLPDITIVLTGTKEGPGDFVPSDSNELACTAIHIPDSQPSPCRVGKKPFVTAGGRLNINGLPDICPTWLKLEDVITDEIPEICNELVLEGSILVNSGFLVTEEEDGDSFFRHITRSSDSHSVKIDLNKDCFTKHAVFKVSAKVR